MVEYVTKHKVLQFLIRVIPLFTLFFTWSGIEGVKQYNGTVYVHRNKLTCIVGLIFILIEILLKLNWKDKIKLNILGHLIFWLPLFYGALTETKRIKNVTFLFYISVVVVVVSCILQLKVIMRERVDTA